MHLEIEKIRQIFRQFLHQSEREKAKGGEGALLRASGRTEQSR